MVCAIILIIIAIFVVVIVLGGREGGKVRKKFTDKITELNANSLFIAWHVEGLRIGVDETCGIYAFNDRILIIPRDEQPQFEIKYENLREAVVKSEQEIYDQGKIFMIKNALTYISVKAFLLLYWLI